MAMSAVCFTATEHLRDRLHKYHSGCGDVVDITNNGGTTAAETDCTTACSGDPLHLCGGAQRLQLYLWNGTLNNWQTPANVGRYEVRTKCLLFIHAVLQGYLTVVPRPRPRASAACHGR